MVTRTVTLPDVVGAPTESADVGTIELMNSINIQAAKNSKRAVTRMIFIDALPPRLGPDKLPYEMAVTYRAQLRVERGSRVTQSIDTLLPIVTPPVQVPKVVAAGVALTAYGRDAEYAATDARF